MTRQRPLVGKYVETTSVRREMARATHVSNGCRVPLSSASPGSSLSSKLLTEKQRHGQGWQLLKVRCAEQLAGSL